MTSIYQTFAAAASQMLSGPLGGTGMLRRKRGGGYDENGEPIPVTHSDIVVSCVVRTKQFWNAGAYLGSKLVAMLDGKVEPFLDDELIVDKSSYTIIEVHPRAPAGTVINYELVIG